MGKYDPGTEAFYRESGEIIRVTVVEDRSTNTMEDYTLRAEEVIQQVGLIIPLKLGEEFVAQQSRDVTEIRHWSLTDKL